MITPPIVTHVPDRPPITLRAYYPQFAEYYRWCELGVKAWFVQNVGPDWVSLDCGANIGYHSILLGQLAPTGRVYAFEPTSTNEMLRDNLAYNDLRNVDVIPVALGAESGRSHRALFRIWGEQPASGDYDFTTIDDFVFQRQLSRVDLIKIDVDSFDFEVLRGAKRTLEQFDPWVIVEINRNLALQGSSPEEVFDWLAARGYTATRPLDSENFLFKRTAPFGLGWLPIAVANWAAASGTTKDIIRLIPRNPENRPWANEWYLPKALGTALTAPQLPVFPPGQSPEWQRWQFWAFARAFAPDLVLGFGTSALETTRAALDGAQSIQSAARGHVFAAESTSAPSGSLTHSSGLPTEAELRCLLDPPVRVLVLWENVQLPRLVECVLGCLLPLLEQREHVVVLNSISDGRYTSAIPYDENGRGMLALGNAWSWRTDLPALIDFLERNRLTHFSSDHAIRLVFESDPDLERHAVAVLGPRHSHQAHWGWFSLNEHKGPYFYPAFL
ncbi:MAG: FkbM family methyltransferase [Candidatus Didemnitutus sp.]|nr:FkbM family methyltransferase [Candidatus Didemnitutus sp.]